MVNERTPSHVKMHNVHCYELLIAYKLSNAMCTNEKNMLLRNYFNPCSYYCLVGIEAQDLMPLYNHATTSRYQV